MEEESAWRIFGLIRREFEEVESGKNLLSIE
jgi:hypothetical protein